MSVNRERDELLRKTREELIHLAETSLPPKLRPAKSSPKDVLVDAILKARRQTKIQPFFAPVPTSNKASTSTDLSGSPAKKKPKPTDETTTATTTDEATTGTNEEVDSTIHDDDNDDEDVLESFEERFPNYVFDDFDDEDETEEDNLKSVGDESRIKQNKEDLAKFLGLECISNDTHSKFDGRRNLPEDLLSECLEWFASLPEIFKQSIISTNPAQPHTLFLVKDAHRIFPDLDIKSLTNVQLYDLPCYGKFPTKRQMLATIGGGKTATLAAKRRDDFIVIRWMPSEEGVPPWNDIHVVENAAEKIELMKTEIEKRWRMRISERKSEEYANGRSNFQRQEVIEKSSKVKSKLEREKFSNGTHNFQLAEKERRAAATGGTGPWTDEEDRKLTMLVSEHGLGYGKWVKIAKEIPGRDNKQCQMRWSDVLDPQISKAPWSKEEYRIILESQQNGPVNKWAHISKHLSGRTSMAIKHIWNNFLKKKVEKYVYSLNIDSEHMIKDSEGRYLIDDIDKCLSSL